MKKTLTFLPAALCLVAAGCGGSYDSEPYTCTNAYHAHEIEHNGRNATLGFRIVLRHIN